MVPRNGLGAQLPSCLLDLLGQTIKAGWLVGNRRAQRVLAVRRACFDTKSLNMVHIYKNIHIYFHKYSRSSFPKLCSRGYKSEHKRHKAPLCFCLQWKICMKSINLAGFGVSSSYSYCLLAFICRGLPNFLLVLEFIEFFPIYFQSFVVSVLFCC